MSDIKMSEVFGVCCKSVVAESFGQYLVVNEVDTARFKNRKHTDAAAHAVNNHDRMVEEIAELKGAINQLLKYNGILTSGNSAVVNAKHLLAKLNQKGEE